MFKFLSLLLIPLCMLFHASSAFAVTATLLNKTPFCVCLEANSSGALDGDKNCAAPGRSTHSSTGGADYIRSVRFTAYAVEQCSKRSKASQIKEFSKTSEFESTFGRATQVHFAATASKTMGPDNNELIKFDVNKVSWNTRCRLQGLSEYDCAALHREKKLASETRTKNGLMYTGFAVAVAVIGVAIIANPSGAGAIAMALAAL